MRSGGVRWDDVKVGVLSNCFGGAVFGVLDGNEMVSLPVSVFAHSLSRT